MRRVIAGLSMLLALSSTRAGAQVQSIEIIPFGGYRWSGGINSLQGISNFDVKDAAAYGVALDANMPRNSATELYWSHWEGDWDATLVGGGTRSGSFKRDDIMLNGIWYAARSGARARPYFTAGLGASIFWADDAETIGRFAWNIGAGLRRDIDQKLGLRADFRWAPTWISTGTGVWCDPFFCYPVTEGEFFDQWEVTGGLIIKLGGHR